MYDPDLYMNQIIVAEIVTTEDIVTISKIARWALDFVSIPVNKLFVDTRTRSWPTKPRSWPTRQCSRHSKHGPSKHLTRPRISTPDSLHSPRALRSWAFTLSGKQPID